LFFDDVRLLRICLYRAVASYGAAAFDGGFAVGQQLVALGLVLLLLECVCRVLFRNF
jgi:hypothetical protein